MVKVEARANNERKGCNVSISMEGNGKDLIEETLAVIQGVMSSLKEESSMLHMLAIRAIGDEPTILFGEDKESDRAKDFERFVATAKFREGVN